MTFEPRQHLGRTVVIRGIARDAHAGAVLELEDRTPIYIAGLAAWEPALRGRSLEVTGHLEERAAQVPLALHGEPQWHGLPAVTFLLERATWTVLP